MLPSDQHGIVMTFGYDHGADEMLYGASSDTGRATIQRNDRPLGSARGAGTEAAVRRLKRRTAAPAMPTQQWEILNPR